MNIAVFYSSKNSKGKKDATGAFIPESARFLSSNNENFITSYPIDCIKLTKQERMWVVLDRLIIPTSDNRIDKWDAIAFFGHGWSGGIQFGIWKKDIGEFVDELACYCNKNLIIALYACLTAENDVLDNDHAKPGPGTDGGFADLLRDEMARQGFTGHIDAHKTSGHTTMNPYVVRFNCEGIIDKKKGGQGGDWLIPRLGEYWNKWSKALHDPKNTLRYRFPFMTREEIIDELSPVKL